jgi:hypothetical protein
MAMLFLMLSSVKLSLSPGARGVYVHRPSLRPAKKDLGCMQGCVTSGLSVSHATQYAEPSMTVEMGSSLTAGKHPLL